MNVLFLCVERSLAPSTLTSRHFDLWGNIPHYLAAEVALEVHRYRCMGLWFQSGVHKPEFEK